MNEVEIRIGSRDDTAAGTRSAETRLRGLTKVGKVAGAALATAGGVAGGLFAKGLADNMNIEKSNDKLAAQLDLTTKEADSAGKVAGKVYADNWGESIDDVNAAIKSVGNNIGDISDMAPKDLQKITEGALALSSTFDVDVNDSTRAAGKLIKTGLAKNATEAFDIITKGMQEGVNSSDDFLDTINEYSPQFSKLGINGKTMLGILHAGLKAGARDTDAVADAFKELSIRVVDGSTTTKQGFKEIGLNAKDMGEKFGKGGKSAEDATEQVIDGLLKVKDPVKQNIAGTKLFGTQWEDTVRKILPSLSHFKDRTQDVDGATSKMADTVGNNAAGKIETAKRKFEQWTQSMAKSGSTFGLVVTASSQMGGGALTAASQIGTMALALRGSVLAIKAQAAATWLANGALKAMRAAWAGATGPIGLAVIAVIAVAAALIYAYKHSEKFRSIVDSVFKAVGNYVIGMALSFVKAFASIFGVLGHLPGKAGAAFRSMQRAAQNAEAKLIRVKRAIDGIHSKNVKINVTVHYGRTGSAPDGVGGNVPIGSASGRIIGAAATGGVKNGLTLVGEHGRELVDLAPGTRVHSSANTESTLARMERSSAAEQVVRIVLEGTGMLAGLRKEIRIKGGNVQGVLGT